MAKTGAQVGDIIEEMRTHNEVQAEIKETVENFAKAEETAAELKTEFQELICRVQGTL